MGLYSDEPGRNPAEESIEEYKRLSTLVDHMRSKDAAPETAEWVLKHVRPMIAEYFNHLGLKEWASEAEERLAAAYRSAGLTEPVEESVGLYEALIALRSAIEKPTPEGIATAELALKDVLHKSPDSNGAKEGLKRLDEASSALKELNKANDAASAASRAKRDALPSDAKLKIIADICQWPEKTPQGVCPACKFPDRVTQTIMTADGCKIHETTVEGCLYRKSIVMPLQKHAERIFHAPEQSSVLETFASTPEELRQKLEAEIGKLFRMLG